MGGFDSKSARTPAAASPEEDEEGRSELPTLTDPVELEEARIASTFTTPPPAIEVGEAEILEDVVLEGDDERLGSFDQVPEHLASSEQLGRSGLDHRAGFLLALIDGQLSIRELLDVSGMSSSRTLDLLDDLRARGIIGLRQPGSDPRERASGSRRATGRPSGVEPRAAPARPVSSEVPRPAFRVIAQGDDAVGEAHTIADAVALLDAARRQGKRHVAIVDEATSALVNEADARAMARI